MRTLHFVPKKEKRERIARETLEIYAPLARRIGVNRVCVELEDLAFFNLNPAAHQSITKRLTDLRHLRSKEVAEVSASLSDELFEAGLDARVFGREKRPYSIWRKLEKKGVGFEDIADIYAFRILVRTRPSVTARSESFISAGAACRNGSAIISRCPSRIITAPCTPPSSGPAICALNCRSAPKPWSASPKTGWPRTGAIRRAAMPMTPKAAEAAGGDPMERLRPLMEILNHGGDPDEFLEHAKLEMFANEVYAFTPKGDLIALPGGATPLDFAYAVHTELGHTAIGAKINGRERPLRTRLSNGDVVQIIKGGERHPPAGWEDLVITGRARAAIRKLIRSSETEEFARIGKVIAEHAFMREGKVFREAMLEDGLKRLEPDTPEELYLALGAVRSPPASFWKRSSRA
jgi:guanosine-3',5'-bis(diphosphate) 3'-pyrophosphohydrolase